MSDARQARSAAADCAESLQEAVRVAAQTGRPLCLTGGGSKAFYGRPGTGEPLDVAGHRGVVDYQPSELVLTARGGTPLDDVEAVLRESAQMLAFEPPHFGPAATLGGTVACGISGPRRPYAGALRDFVLGVTVIDGRGRVLRFGGQVMKNVAGYDASRLMAGALGTLGVLLEVSLKVLPLSAAELTLAQEVDAGQALPTMCRLGREALPVTGCCHDGERLYLRLSGAASAVRAAHSRIGGEHIVDADALWHRLREHQHGFFAGPEPLWRLSVPAATPLPSLPGKWLLDWGGAQRWLRSTAAPHRIREAAARAGGHATLFRGGDRDEVFAPLAPALAALHRRLKSSFDPHGVLNPQRMYAAL